MNSDPAQGAGPPRAEAMLLEPPVALHDVITIISTESMEFGNEFLRVKEDQEIRSLFLKQIWTIVTNHV